MPDIKRAVKRIAAQATSVQPIYVGLSLVGWLMRINRPGKPSVRFCHDERNGTLKRIAYTRRQA